MPPNPLHLLLLKVGWDMENISDQQKDPFNQQVVFFLPILPALGKRRKKERLPYLIPSYITEL